MNIIRIDVGVYTELEIDLSQFDFTGISKVVMTVKNKGYSGTLFEREFLTSAKHTITITPEESMLILEGAEYDFDIITTDSKRYKNGDNGKIVLRTGCGVCSNGSQ